MSFQRALPEGAFDAAMIRLQLPRHGCWRAVTSSEATNIIEANPPGRWRENQYIVDGRAIVITDHPNFPPSYLARVIEPSAAQIEAAAQWLIADDDTYKAEPDFARRAARHMLTAALTKSERSA